MEFVGADADLGAHAEFIAVGEACGGIDVYGCESTSFVNLRALATLSVTIASEWPNPYLAMWAIASSREFTTFFLTRGQEVFVIKIFIGGSGLQSPSGDGSYLRFHRSYHNPRISTLDPAIFLLFQAKKIVAIFSCTSMVSMALQVAGRCTLALNKFPLPS